jgi:transposase
MNQIGEVILSLQVKHNSEGFYQFDQARAKLGISAEDCKVGIETSHNLLVDFLVERGYTHIHVLSPNTVKSAQGLYRQSGAKSDIADARLIADMLRVDQGKYAEWQPDSSLTCQIRAHVSMIGFQTKLIKQTENRLRAILLRYYPAALVIFSSLDIPITLDWIIQYPTPLFAQQVTLEEFREFAKKHHYPHPKHLAICYARLRVSQPEPNTDIVAIYSQEAVILAQLLLQLVKSKNALLSQIGKLYIQHPDYEIYHSLPGAGEYLEPALLAKFGDNRNRFPTVQVVQAVAGTCPVTQQSGKSKYVYFRRSCDHEFRQIVQQWAKNSLKYSPWAVTYYNSTRSRCDSDNEFYRKLANRWMEVVWKLWQDRVPYDEQKHLNAQVLRKKPKT